MSKSLCKDTPQAPVQIILIIPYQSLSHQAQWFMAELELGLSFGKNSTTSFATWPGSIQMAQFRAFSYIIFTWDTGLSILVGNSWANDKEKNVPKIFNHIQSYAVQWNHRTSDIPRVKIHQSHSHNLPVVELLLPSGPLKNGGPLDVPRLHSYHCDWHPFHHLFPGCKIHWMRAEGPSGWECWTMLDFVLSDSNWLQAAMPSENDAISNLSVDLYIVSSHYKVSKEPNVPPKST